MSDTLPHEHSLMGETTVHFEARVSATDVLRRFFGNQGKKVFIASNLQTMYPSQKAFYPDLLVVFEIENRHRQSWNVMQEKRGLDFVLEIVSTGTRRNDQVEKLNLYARLGIPEYFMFDPDKFTLRGFRLDPTKSNQAYEEIPKSQPRCVFSERLGLHLAIDAHKLRFILAEGIEVLFTDELIHRLNQKLADKDELIAEGLREIEKENKQKEEERALKEVEKARADKLEEELAQLIRSLKK